MFMDRFSRSMRVGLLLSATVPVFPTLACNTNEYQYEQGGGDDQYDSDAGGDLNVRQEVWEYVNLPRFGLAPMQQVLEVGSPANLAWLNVGEPIENYLAVPMHAPNATINNGAAVVYILPERCLGDYNNNGHIDLQDVGTFAYAYINAHIAADLTGDGQVDIRDQILFLHLATIPCYSAW